MTPQAATPPPGPRLSWGAGGWVILLGLLLVAAVTIWRIMSVTGSGTPSIGDGQDPSTYGFDLTNLTVPKDLVAGSGLPRDGLPVLDTPPLWTTSVVDSLAGQGRSKYLVTHDRVVGVVLNGEARAYPIQILNWHEVVNDTLGGIPIAVTYSPLCDAVAVWDRRSSRSTKDVDGPDTAPALGESAAGRPALQEFVTDTLRFGHSGLLYNSDLILYDRSSLDEVAGGSSGDTATSVVPGVGARGGGGSSLWCQLTGEPIAGPAVEEGRRLVALPCVLTHWKDWWRLHPTTTVLARDESRKERYRRDPYVSYYGSDLLRFPVRPLPPKEELPWKTRCVLIGEPGSSVVVPLPEIAASSDARGDGGAASSGNRGAGGLLVETGGRSVRLRYLDALVPAVEVETDGPPPPLRYGFWFAAYALEGSGRE